MRRLYAPVLIALVVLSLYGLAFAETEPGPDKKPDLLPNAGFEEAVPIPSKSRAYPVGWYTSFSRGTEIVWEIGEESGNAVRIIGKNPNAIYTNFVYAPIPCPQKLKAIVGRTITLYADVQVAQAAGMYVPDGEQPAAMNGLKTLEQGKDFTAELGLGDYINYAGVNVTFLYYPAKGEEVPAGMKTGAQASPAKTRVVAFSPSEDFVTVSCEVTVPEKFSAAVVALEAKGVVNALFRNVRLDYPADGPTDLDKPYNLDMSGLRPAWCTTPKGWYKNFPNSAAYAYSVDHNALAGSRSLEIGNFDFANRSENFMYSVNFDINANQSLAGKKVKLSAKVLTEMAPGVTPDGDCFHGEKVLTRVLDEDEVAGTPDSYVYDRSLIVYNNYASAKLICRKADGKVLKIQDSGVEKHRFVFGKSDEWREVYVEFVVPARTFGIEWGFYTMGVGRAWFDDVKLEVEGGATYELQNTGFEEQHLGGPAGWKVGGSAPGAMAIIDDTVSSGGADNKSSLLLVSPFYGQLGTTKATYTLEGGSVNGGKKYILTADVKAEIIRNDFVQMAYLELQAVAEKMVSITCMDAWPRSVPLTGDSKGWQRLKAALIVEDSVAQVNVNLTFKGIGKVWVDNVKLEEERLAMPTTALANGEFAAGAGEPSEEYLEGWTIEGLKRPEALVVHHFINAPGVGELKDDEGRFYQDVDPGAATIQTLIGTPVTLKALVKCDKGVTAGAGIEFLDESGNAISSSSLFADKAPGGVVVSGVEPADFLFAPYSLTKVSGVIPSGTRKIRCMLKFNRAGSEGSRYQIMRFSLGAEDEVTNREVLGEIKTPYIADAAEMDFSAPAVDSINPASSSLFADYFPNYGVKVVSKPRIASGALKNAEFGSAGRRRISDFNDSGTRTRAYLVDDIELGLYNYTVIPVNDDTKISQVVAFYDEEQKAGKFAGQDFSFRVRAQSYALASAEAGIEFLDSTGKVIGEPVVSALEPYSAEELVSAISLRPSAVSVSAPIPADAVSARVFLKGAGTGHLILANAEVSSIYLAAGLLDKIAYLMWFDFGKLNVLLALLLFGFLIIYFIYSARRRDLFIRKIAGLDSVDEAVGRATEMGKPILYSTGLDPIDYIGTIAAINILGRIAKKVAEYDTPLLVPNRDPIVMTIAQETVKAAFLDAGRPDAYREESVYYVTESQFAYVAAVAGTMMRDRPAANFYMGGFYAESLILAETGALSGAIQVAGTDSVHQLPFFIVACDYTLIGEELYAASAYLSREPMQMGSLKGSDYSKMIFFLIILVGTLIVSFNSYGLRWIVDLISVQ